MRYETAMQMAGEGLRLQRTAWNCKDRYVYRSGTTLTLRCREGRLEEYQPTDDDRQAIDWEVMRTQPVTHPIRMRRVERFEKLKHPGDFFWECHESGRSINILLPSSSGHDPLLAGCSVGGDGWKWDGNSDRPTLKPSVRCTGKDDSWHGFVRNGFLVEA